MIRRITREEIPELMRVQLLTLPGTLPGRFGDAFMSLYYRSLLERPQFFCDGFFWESRLCGFFAYSSDSGAALGGALRSHLPEYCLRLAAAVLRRPQRALPLLQVARNIFSLGGAAQPAVANVRAELLSLGVLPEFRRSSPFGAKAKINIAAELLNHSFRTLAEAGERVVKVYVPPPAVNPFIHQYYQSLGFRLAGEERRFGAQTNIYVRDV